MGRSLYENNQDFSELDRFMLLNARNHPLQTTIDREQVFLWLQRELGEQSTWLLLHDHTCENHAAFQNKL